MTPSNALTYSKRAPHQQRVVDALAVIGEHSDARRRVRHCAELGEPLAGEPDRHRADRMNVAVAGLLTESPDLLDDAGDIRDRIGVGHRVHRGEAAERSSTRAGLDGLGVLATRLPQVGVQVDEAGQRDQAVGVDDLRASEGASSTSSPPSTYRSPVSPPSGRTPSMHVCGSSCCDFTVVARSTSISPPSRR